MQNLSDEELVRKYIISHIQCFIKSLPEHHQWSKERDSLKFELLTRLERGRKAIEAMGKVENWLRNDSLYFSKLQNIINDYQR